MLILVTGATGFIGSHLVRALVESGHRVRALVRETSDCSALSFDGIDVRRGPLSNRRLLADACREADVVFNLAGRMGGDSATVEEMRLVNVSAVAALLEACKSSGVRQFVHCSTPGVVGMVGVAPECLPYRPAGSYERTKADGERAVLSCHEKGRVIATVVRPDFVYGPGDVHKLKLFTAIKEGRFPIIGGGRSLLHPTYVDDVIRGLMLVMDRPAAHGEKFNLAGPGPITVLELVRTIAEAVGGKVKHVRVPVPALKLAALGVEMTSALLGRRPPVTRYQINFFTRDHASDISKARQMLGYEPKVTLEEGIARTVEWYREKGCL